MNLPGAKDHPLRVLQHVVKVALRRCPDHVLAILHGRASRSAQVGSQLARQRLHQRDRDIVHRFEMPVDRGVVQTGFARQLPQTDVRNGAALSAELEGGA